jgi:ATP/maltotriose-dependent transcriptional regulator MalT
VTLPVAPLVGREPELSTLAGRLAALRDGKPAILGLAGEPGIGKSRLLGELGDRAARDGVLVLAGRAAELERDLPFSLLVDALDVQVAAHARAGLDLDSDAVAELGRVLPAFGRAAGLAPGPRHGERHRTARAVRALLERLAADRPVALVLDDVHWADPASADALALLLHRPPTAPVLVALATRTGRAPTLEAALAQAVRHGAAELLELGPLSADAVGKLLHGVGPVARRRLYEDSGGNPFYLEELRRSLEAGREQPGIGGLRGVPPAVQAALAGELLTLTPGVRTVLEGAAVAGDPFEPELAAAAADVPESETLPALDELLAAGLVRPTDQPRRFRFRHPLIRRAVYEAAGGGWRLAAHARAAEALAARGASAAQRAHHAERAGRPGDHATIALLTDAAGEAMAAAPATAAGWLEAALRLLPAGPEHATRRLELLGALGGALAQAGRVADARDVLRRLLAALPPAAADERVAMLVALTDLAALWTDRPEEPGPLLEAERAALGDDRPDLVAALALAMARVRSEYGDRAAEKALADEARRAARAAGDPLLEADAAVTLAGAAHCGLRRDDPAALARVEAKLAEAEALVAALPEEILARRLAVLNWLTIAHLFTGSFSRALAGAEHGLVLARRSGQGIYAGSLLLLRGTAHFELGRLDEAEADAEEALDGALLSGNGQIAFFASAVLSWASLARGDLDAALRHGLAVWEHMPKAPYIQAGFSVADARLAGGDPAGALAALDEYGWPNPTMWTLDRPRGLEVVVRVLLALGRVDEAADVARGIPAESGGRRTGVFGALAAHADAGVWLAQGRSEEAARVALAGAAAAEAAGATLWAERCRTLAGEAFAAAGDATRAREELRRAAATLGDRGAWGYRDAALLVLRRLGDRPRVPSPATAPADGRLAALTPREREVATLVADGLTNAQIAAHLKLSERTVEKHVSSGLAKLGVPSRAAVVRLLARP